VLMRPVPTIISTFIDVSAVEKMWNPCDYNIGFCILVK